MNRGELAQSLQSMLGLAVDPIAVAFVTSAPPGVREFTGVAPSTCALWREAEKGVFYAPAESRFNCAVGSMVMGFELPSEVKTRLMDVVDTMISLGYFAEQEPERIPSVGKPKNGIVYGPLEVFPVDPDLVLMWLSPRQAMLFDEASGNAGWTSTDGRTLGRPGCAALPTALNTSQPTVSFGCAGMRTFTGISNEQMLAVIPGTKLGDVVTRLQATAESNRQMQQAYDEMHAGLARA